MAGRNFRAVAVAAAAVALSAGLGAVTASAHSATRGPITSSTGCTKTGTNTMYATDHVFTGKTTATTCTYVELKINSDIQFSTAAGPSPQATSVIGNDGVWTDHNGKACSTCTLYGFRLNH